MPPTDRPEVTQEEFAKNCARTRVLLASLTWPSPPSVPGFLEDDASTSERAVLTRLRDPNNYAPALPVPAVPTRSPNPPKRRLSEAHAVPVPAAKLAQVPAAAPPAEPPTKRQRADSDVPAPTAPASKLNVFVCHRCRRRCKTEAGLRQHTNMMHR